MDPNPPPGDEQGPANSGNRWEPTSPEAQPAAVRYVSGATGTTETTATAPPSRPTWLTRATAALAGSAAAALLLGGLGGFAVGRATTAGDDGRVDQRGVPTGFDRDGSGFQDDHGFGPGGPQLDQQPDGQVPGMPGQDDGQQDDGTDGTDT